MEKDETRSRPSRPPFADRIRNSMIETLAYARGEIEMPISVLTVPDPPPAYDAARIQTLRTTLGMSQSYFSRLLNVSPKTVQSWEQGTRIPGQSSARLLQLIENPELLASFRRPETNLHGLTP